MPPYTQFRMIGYQVPTAAPGLKGPPQRPVLAGWSAGQEPAAVATIPVPGTLPDDPRIRLKRLAAVVDAAYARLQGADMGDNNTTLKIFIAPEFYLRPPSSIGADYAGNTYPVQVNAQILQAVNDMFVHASFTDWLFVCGTVMWNTAAQQGPVPLYFNTALVVRGGQANSLYIVEKRVPSTIDGVPVVTFSDGVSSWQGYGGPGNDPKVGPYLATWRRRKQHLLTFDGVTIGVEVCLDHLATRTCRVLKKVIEDWYWNQGQNHPGVQLHILTAGGMQIQPSSLAAKLGGYILRADGMALNSPRVQMQQVTGYTSADWETGVGIGPADDDAVASLADINPALVVPIAPLLGTLVPNPPAPYPAPPLPQALAFFPATPLP